MKYIKNFKKAIDAVNDVSVCTPVLVHIEETDQDLVPKQKDGTPVEFFFSEGSKISNRTYVGGDPFRYTTTNKKPLDIDDKAFDASISKHIYEDIGQLLFNKDISEIDSSCFSEIGNLQWLQLPRSMKDVKDNAFEGCIELDNLTFNTDVSHIGAHVFKNCFYLDHVTYQGTAELWDSIPKDSSWKEDSYVVYVNYKDGGRVFDIPSNWIWYRTDTNEEPNYVNLDAINGEDKFKFFSKFGIVQSDVSILEINELFNQLNAKVSAIRVPESVTHIGKRFLAYDYAIGEFYIPEGVTEIGDMAFFYCLNLSKLTIFDNIEKIGKYAFYNCKIGDFKLPTKVTRIEDGTFQQTNLKSFYIPDTITYVGKEAFSYCTSLEKLIIDTSINEIPTNFLNGASNLKSLKIKNIDNIKKINDLALRYCKNIGDFKLPSQIEYIGNHALMDIPSKFESLPITIKHIGEYGFGNCKQIGNFCIPNTLEYLGPSAFSGVKANEIKIQENQNIEKIGSRMFEGADISVLELPKNILQFKDRVFYDASIGTFKYHGTKAEYEHTFKGEHFCTDSSFVVTCTDGNIMNENTVIEYVSTESEKINVGDYFGGARVISNEYDGQRGWITFNCVLTKIACDVTDYMKKFKKLVIPKTVYDIYCPNLENIETIKYEGTMEMWRNVVNRKYFNIPSSNEVFQNIECTDGNITYRSKRVRYKTYSNNTISPYMSQWGDANYQSTGTDGDWKYWLFDKFVKEIPTNAINSSDVKEVEFLDNILFNNSGCLNGTKILDLKINATSFNPLNLYDSLTISTSISLHIGTGVNSIPTEENTTLSKYLTSIDVSKYNSRFDSRGNCNAICDIDNVLVLGCCNSVIPDDVQTIGNYAFRYAVSLGNLDLKNISRVLGQSFYGSKGIKDLVLNNISTIEYLAFYDSDVSTLKIDTVSLQYIGDRAFRYTPLSKVEINSLDNSREWELQDYAFANCEKLMDVSISDNCKYFGYVTFSNCSNLRHINMPKSLKNISYQCFYNCLLLEGDIVIPDGISTISSESFEYCKSLGSFTLGKNVECVDSKALAMWGNIGDSALTTIKFNKKLRTIGYNAFNHCSNVSGVCFPESLTTIYEGAFSHCHALKLTDEDGRENGKIPNSVSTIENWAFSYCKSLGNISLPENENYRTIRSNTFEACPNLKNINIPKYIDKIEDSAFTTSDDYQPSGKIRNFIFWNENPPQIESNSLGNIEWIDGIYVPDESVDAYKTASNWTQYADLGLIKKMSSFING